MGPSVRQFLRAAAFAAAGIVVAPAWAEPFAAVSLGQARWERCIAIEACDKRDAAGTVRLGYRFSPWLGVEARYADLGQTSSQAGRVIFPDPGPVLARTRARALGINAIASLPVSPRMALAAIAGVARFRVDGRIESPAEGITIVDALFTGERRSTAPYFGVKAAYALSPQVELSLEAERYRIEYASLRQDADFLALGVSYRFR